MADDRLPALCSPHQSTYHQCKINQVVTKRNKENPQKGIGNPLKRKKELPDDMPESSYDKLRFKSKWSFYSAFGSSAGAAASVASAALAEDLRPRRVFLAAVAVLAMLSSKSTSSMKQIGAASPRR